MKKTRCFKAVLCAMLALVMACAPVMNVSAAKTYPDVDMFESATTIKGLQGAEWGDEDAYGAIEHSLVNIFLDECIISPECTWVANGYIEPYVFEGETFYFDASPAGMGFVEACNYEDMSLSVVFLLRWRNDTSINNDVTFLIDEDSKRAGYNFYAPNTDLSTYGGRAIRAYWHFLMEELIAEDGHIDNIILGNEVNMPNAWHYSGTTNATTVATKYADAFYYMYDAVRKYTDVTRCSISLDHSWNHNDEGRGIGAREFLHIFNDRLAATGRDVDWCVSTHLYPALLYDTRIWEHPYGLTTNSSNTQMVDGTNLSAMTNYIRDVFGEEHRVMLTEQGFTRACGEEAQAAALAYSYYAAKYDPMVDSFLLNTEYVNNSEDYRIAGTLAEQVYTKIDNGNLADQKWIADVCLPVIGVSSWEQIIPNYDAEMIEVDYSDVFNAEDYYNYNPDLAAVLEYDEDVLLNHFVKWGMAEGRQGSEEFNVNAYKANNPDLVPALGADNKPYYLHYIQYGKAEGRVATGTGTVPGSGTGTGTGTGTGSGAGTGTVPGTGTTVTTGYEAVFDAEYYYNSHSDLAAVLGNNAAALLDHFVNWGMAEGRCASAEFDLNAYKANNPDLVNVFGGDNKSYYMHYIQWGKAEGRLATGAGAAPTPAGDYSLVFDAEYYYNNNPDLAAVFGYDEGALLDHFVNCGMSEGRIASADFDLGVYKTMNPDLVAVFGADNRSFYEHYMTCGHTEGRMASLNYSLVFDSDYYYNRFSDLAAALGNDYSRLLVHFINAGMMEGRKASEDFDINVYKAYNPDLVAIYGGDNRSYYVHYMQYGYAEGRRSN